MTLLTDFLGLSSTQATLWVVLFLTGLSFVVGILGGLVGLALGTMRLPALLLLGFPAPVAAGTSITVSTLSAAVGAYRHLREGRVDRRAVVVMGVPSVVGAFLGGFASGRAPEGLLVSVVGALVVWQGIELFLRAAQRARTSGTPSGAVALRFTPARMAIEGGIGLAVGLVGGAVGLILGSLRLPALVRVLGMDPRVAAGTNLAIGFLMGLFGFLGHALLGQADGLLIVTMGITGMIGNYYGARLTGNVSTTILLRAMGTVLALVGVILLWQGLLR